jgi:hypothetical protein
MFIVAKIYQDGIRTSIYSLSADCKAALAIDKEVNPVLYIRNHIYEYKYIYIHLYTHY